MKKFTVILLYPDYLANTFGHDTYMTCVEADSVELAIFAATSDAIEDNDRMLSEREDWFVIAVIEGDHQDVKSQANELIH
jgi:hypothetical protein